MPVRFWWGVPIIVFYCDKCREPITDRKILDGIVDLFRKHTADVWYERTAAELLPPGMTCPKCVAHVTKALQGVAGVASAEVSLEKGEAVVEGTPVVQALVAAVVEEGYEAEEARS